MDVGAVIHSYGGPALFVWARLQGEAAVIVGRSLAAQGFWPWWAVWLVACGPRSPGISSTSPWGAATATTALGRVAHAEAWIVVGAVTLGLAVPALTRSSAGG
ncbi:MAG TPA: hypothetical protein VH116_02030 [Gemmatimonadales bacterium]|nr:hypothetical protein [Gemmatimonadales bacterium]